MPFLNTVEASEFLHEQTVKQNVGIVCRGHRQGAQARVWHARSVK